jgi:choline dehydrogenase-like flavoprotein
MGGTDEGNFSVTKITDVVVVGSGFGGAVTACRLAQAGFSVQVIERGRRYEENDFPTLPNDSVLAPDLRRWIWDQSQGLWDVLDLEEIVSLQAAGYGGGSLIYANVHLRPPPQVFDQRWPADYRDPKTLEPFYDLAGYMLDVAPITEHASLMAGLAKADQMKRAAIAIDRGPERGFFYPPLAISRTDGRNRFGKTQRSCNGCGACCTGCPRRAKNTLDYNYLALAERYGAGVSTQVEVKHVIQHHDGTWELTCVDHLSGSASSYRARNVFLCAGAIHSTRLLRTASLLTPEGRRSRRLAGAGYFPGGDALAMVYETAHPQHPSFGPAITTTTAAIDPKRPESFFLIQDGGYAPELARFVGLLRAPLWLGRNRVTRRGRGSVTRSPNAPPSQPPLTTPRALASPLDDVLNAIARGDFHKMSTPELKAEWKSFLREVKRPTLVTPVVARTIDEAIDDSIRSSPLTRWLNPNGALTRLLKRTQHWVIRKLYGSANRFADRALRAISKQANLSRHQIASRVLGYDDGGAQHRTMFLAMGRDAVAGALTYDRRTGQMIADLDLFHLAPGYAAEQRLMADLAGALGGELRINPAWSFLGKPITVHNQGGCGMTDDDLGVTTPTGAVRGAKGLYISDASVFPTSVGVNPSATILAIAEKNALAFIQKELGRPWPNESSDPRALEYAVQSAAARDWAAQARANHVQLEPPAPPSIPFRAKPVGVAFDEEMQGYFFPTDAEPTEDAQYRVLETLGRPDHALKFNLTLEAPDLSVFIQDLRHRMRASGTILARLPGTPDELQYECRGRVDLLTRRYKPYAIDRAADPDRFALQNRLAGGYRTRRGRPRRGEQRFMTYRLWLRDRDGRRWLVSGKKRIRDDPGPDAWRDTSSLMTSLFSEDATGKLVFRGAGVAHVDLEQFLFSQLPSVRATGIRRDRTRAMWAKTQFAVFFFGTLQRIYLPQVNRAIDTLFKMNSSNLVRETPKVVK